MKLRVNMLVRVDEETLARINEERAKLHWILVPTPLEWDANDLNDAINEGIAKIEDTVIIEV